MFGNIDILKKNSDLWSTIDTILTAGGHVGTSIPLRCENHRDTTTTISAAEDFEKVPEGGCLLRCGFILSCGHQCPLICHSYDRAHKAVQCKVDCERVCELNHVCRLKCWQECVCTVIVTKKFLCGHKNDVYCYVDPKEAKCQTVLDVKLPNCEHEAKKPCHLKIHLVKCTVPCDHRLDDCGHTCVRNCHVTSDPDHLKYVCRKPCAKANKGCSHKSDELPKEHQCKKMCHEECDNCNVQVLKKRSTCAHKETVACCVNLDDIPCKKKCTRMLACNHFCKKKCFQPCDDCDQLVSKEIPDCKHNIRIKCNLEPTRSMCEKKCERKLPCGHTCSGLCKDVCDPSKCIVPVATKLDSPCGHKVSLPCAVFHNFNPATDGRVLLAHCNAACGATLECGHACGGRCADCYQGRLHVACNKHCGKRNFCGHECIQPCSKICPPCRKKCEVKCMHSRCTKQCGAACSFCKEKCGRGCEHTRCTRLCSQPCSRKPCEERCPRPLPCGHPCRGFCGEPCPNICKICRPEEFPRETFGDEFDDSAIFVLLEDCGDILHSENIENLKNNDNGLLLCPLCTLPIINTQRYRDRITKITIHNSQVEIRALHDKLRGNLEKIDNKRKEFIESLNHQLVPKTRKIRDFFMLVIRPLIRYRRNNKEYDLLDVEMHKVHLNILKILNKYCTDYYTSTSVLTLCSEMDENVSMICKYLGENVAKLSVQQQLDLEKELKRIHAILNLSKALSHPTFEKNNTNPTFMEAEKNARTVVLSWNIYNHTSATRALKVLQDVIGENFMTQERDVIVKAIDLVVENW